ncbi:hypothetical protein E2C01_048503 [Portunus trituberculatus]|uniref:Uncharacterized protein n=1 Tax=Portunus trituberculatus TaxID=210409 RepID=A0A5B7G404_PORTR|nr:hypothetical protein [Portunus trituberculatus]
MFLARCQKSRGEFEFEKSVLLTSSPPVFSLSLLLHALHNSQGICSFHSLRRSEDLSPLLTSRHHSPLLLALRLITWYGDCRNRHSLTR